MAADAPPHEITRPANLQTWESLSFLHWPYPVDVVRRCVPPGLDVEVHGDTAWVGVIPFRMRNARPGFMPASRAFERLGTFPEVNVRTYVTGPDGPGVWFLALEASNPVFVAAARGLGIPYNWAEMRIIEGGSAITYVSRRRPPHAASALADVTVDVGREMAPHDIGPFENYLVSRWRAYHGPRAVLLSTRVDHPPWTLHEASFHGDVASLLRATGLPDPVGEPVTHFSPGLDVRLAPPRRVRPSSWTTRTGS